MPRRRPSQKAKSHSKPRPVDRKDSQLKRWGTLADIELDEEDQFHASRDKILLDEGDEVDEDGDEEEVFALQGVSSDSDDDDEADPYEAADDDAGSDGMQVDSDADSELTLPESKSKHKPSKAVRDTKKSSSQTNASDSEEEGTWGRSKGAYYSSNAAELDSEDEEANELEEQEALRLQAKTREAVCDEDFGLGDVVEGDIEPPEAMEQEESPNPPLTKVPQDKLSILRSLEKECPETLALARDWEDTTYSLVETKARIEALKDAESDALELGLQHMYYQALLTYATTLAFCLHLRATDKYTARPELLRRHPILKRLLTLKEGINTLESLGVGKDVSDDVEDEDDDLADEDEEDGDLWSLIKKKGLESDELADLLEDAAVSTPSPSPPPPSSKKPNPTRKEHAEKNPKNKRRKTPAAVHNSDQGTQGLVFDLLEPEYTRASRKNKVVPLVDTVAAADPYGEVTTLQSHDLADKRARKKSLRFYVAHIESASSRRTNARANAISGDDDIPYRERRKEREARLEKAKERKKEKGQFGAGGDDLDGDDPEVSRRKRKRGMDDEDAEDDSSGTNGYYDLVKQDYCHKEGTEKSRV
ncbi:hypothetical protein J3R82DRAFT_9521 [Butyriboletus roseoflavus]|nr:hypothetical protein J3R82DRAFT_9521 [Butyriboletus roseoflavus]